MHPGTGQNIFYLTCLLILAVALPFVYHLTHQGVILFQQGERAFVSGRFSQAAALYKQAEAQGIHSIPLLRHLALSHLALGHSQRAEKLYRRLIAQDPENAMFSLELAHILYIRHRYDEALRQLHRIAPAGPEQRKVLFLQARIYTAMGEFAAAIRNYKHILGESG